MPDTPEPADTRFWVVMKATSWESITVAGISLQAPSDGPDRFLPVFTSEEAARQWAGPDVDVFEARDAHA